MMREYFEIGWLQTTGSEEEHYFMSGTSLCRKYIVLKGPYNWTDNAIPKCMACMKRLEERNAKKQTEAEDGTIT